MIPCYNGFINKGTYACYNGFINKGTYACYNGFINKGTHRSLMIPCYNGFINKGTYAWDHKGTVSSLIIREPTVPLVKVVITCIIFGTSKSIAFFARNHAAITKFRKRLLVIWNCSAGSTMKRSERLFKNILIA